MTQKDMKRKFFKQKKSSPWPTLIFTTAGVATISAAFLFAGPMSLNEPEIGLSDKQMSKSAILRMTPYTPDQPLRIDHTEAEFHARVAYLARQAGEDEGMALAEATGVEDAYSEPTPAIKMKSSAFAINHQAEPASKAEIIKKSLSANCQNCQKPKLAKTRATHELTKVTKAPAEMIEPQKEAIKEAIKETEAPVEVKEQPEMSEPVKTADKEPPTGIAMIEKAKSTYW